VAPQAQPACDAAHGMNGRRFILVGGGVRSGKSAFALSAARRLGARTIFPAAAALVAAALAGAWMYRRLGGLTGDVYGAVIELSEVAFLIAAVGRA
jgi:cobalamin synthase